MAAGESARDEARRAREKAERLAHRAAMFDRGADGEERTAQILSDLGPEWVSLHDHRWPGRRLANIDHIVVGPGGIFVIDSKNWTGTLRVDGQTLRQNGRSREKSVAGAADAALAVAELVSPYAHVTRPVLCFVRDEDLSGWVRDVMVCSTLNLARMLRSREPILDPAQVADAALRLNVELRAAVSREPHATSAVRNANRPAATSAPRPSRNKASKRAPSPARLLAVAGGALALYLSMSTVLPAIGDGVADKIVELADPDRSGCESAKAKQQDAANNKKQAPRTDC